MKTKIILLILLNAFYVPVVLAQNIDKKKIYKVKILYIDGKRIKGKLVGFQDSTISLIVLKDTVNAYVKNISKIIVVRKFKHIQTSLIISVPLGIASAWLVNNTYEPPTNTGYGWSPSLGKDFTTILGGAGGLYLGALVSGLVIWRKEHSKKKISFNGSLYDYSQLRPVLENTFK